MIAQFLRGKRAVHNFIHGRHQADPLGVAEWVLLFIMWLISLATLYLLWWKANPPL